MTRVLTNSTSFIQLSQRNVCYNIHQHQLSDYSNSNFKFKCSFLLSLRYIHRWFSFYTARRSPVRPIKRLKYASQLVEIKWSPQKLCDRGTTIPARVLVFSLRIANSRPSSEAINRRRGNAVHLIHSFGAHFYLLALYALAGECSDQGCMFPWREMCSRWAFWSLGTAFLCVLSSTKLTLSCLKKVEAES